MRILRRTIGLLLTVFLLSAGCAWAERLHYIAPTLLPATTREMKSPGFWISRHPSPDKIVMTPGEIEQFNRSIREKKLAKDLLALPTEYPGENLKSTLEDVLKAMREKDYFLSSDARARDVFFEDMKARMNLQALPASIPIRYGFTVRFSDERIFPTDEALYEDRGDIDFDEVQNDDLDAGTPVVILHTSADGAWSYVQTALSAGWVKSDLLAAATKEDVGPFLSATDFVVVTAPKADVFLNPELTQFYDYVRMGSSFPVESENENCFVVRLPVRSPQGTVNFQKGYIQKQDASRGFLAYSARNVIDQAFRLLNAPYGWGGMNGEQDCSRFLIEIFSTVGIHLPRNSADQAQAGKVLAAFAEENTEAERLEVLKNTIGGISYMPLKGHIMLYLGMVNDRPYAIHATWAYREKGAFGDRARIINKVAVTELSLGKGTHKRSWLERLLSVNQIAP